MKRIIILLVAIFTMSMTGFSQIRIEKRHHNRGWYISTPAHKKKVHKENISTNEKPAVLPLSIINEDLNPVEEQMAVEVVQAVLDSTPAKIPTSQVKSNKSFSIIKVIPAVINKVETVSSSHINEVASSFNETKKIFKENKQQVATKILPDDSLFGVLWDLFVALMKLIGIIFLVLVVAVVILAIIAAASV